MPFFFFPQAFAGRALCINDDKELGINMEGVEGALQWFDFEIQADLGLGFIYSFIKGTRAYIARKLLADRLAHFLPEIEKALVRKEGVDDNDPVVLCLKGDLASELKSRLRQAPVCSLEGLREGRTTHQKNGDDNFLDFLVSLLMLCFFPITVIMAVMKSTTERQSLFKPNKDLFSALISLLNPFYWLKAAAYVLQNILYSLVDTGVEKDQESGPIRELIKTVLGLAFAVLIFPLTFLEELFEIPLDLLRQACGFVAHVIGSLIQAVSDEERCVTTVPLTIEADGSKTHGTAAILEELPADCGQDKLGSQCSGYHPTAAEGIQLWKGPSQAIKQLRQMPEAVAAIKALNELKFLN